MKLILASGSEWRKKLMEMMGYEFEVKVSDVDESGVDWENPEGLVTKLARMKGEEVVERTEGDRVIIAADTVIFFKGKVIGKPDGKDEAAEIIKMLAENEHDVWSGLWVKKIDSKEANEVKKLAVVSKVGFNSMSNEEVLKYLSTNEWEGKAGAYQVQRSIRKYVKGIKGDIGNVVGLPLVEVEEILSEWGIKSNMHAKDVEEKLREEVFLE
jgi:septum formation protein